MKFFSTLEPVGNLSKINRMAKEGWEAKSIGGLGAPTGVSGVYVLMEREITKPA